MHPFFDDPAVAAYAKNQQVKLQKVANVKAGQPTKFAWMDPPMAAAYYPSGTATAATSCSAQTMTIYTDASTTATVSQVDTGTSTGSGMFLITTNGNAPPQMYTVPQPPGGQHQHKQYDPRILNRYLSASDLLEDFIKDLGEMGVKQAEVLHIPVELFINWLIVKSAEEDGHEVDDLPLLPGKVHRSDRCRSCGRFVTKQKRQAGALFCNGDHYERFLERLAA